MAACPADRCTTWKRGLKERGVPALGKFAARFYAVGVVIGCMGIGNMFQSNQAYVQFVNVTGGAQGSWFSDKGWLFGLIVAGLVALVIVGGIKSIVRVTEKIVPFMAVFYVVCSLVIIGMNYEALPFAFNAIVAGAFSPESLSGGALGVMIIGFQRAVFSNEAGIGSAAIAHSAVRTKEPITEGFVALLEPLIDTVIICTLTALVIVTTLYYDASFTQGLGGIEMTSQAFERNISWSPYTIAVAGLLFAFSTMIAWSYYGLKGWTYLVGESRAADIGFKTVFLRFCRYRSVHPAGRRAGLLRCDGVRDLHTEHSWAVHPGTCVEAPTGPLSRQARVRTVSQSDRR